MPAWASASPDVESGDGPHEPEEEAVAGADAVLRQISHRLRQAAAEMGVELED
jgi:hypothetical protein